MTTSIDAIMEGLEDDPLDKPPPRRRSGRPRRDPKPASEQAKESEPTGIPPGRVEDVFAQILSLPAIVYKAPGTSFQCDWCADHFAKQGPRTAKELVENRSHYPALYAGMEKIAAAWLAFSLMPMVISYVAPPAIHHGPTVLEPMSPLFGVPPRKPHEEVNESVNGIRRHQHTSATDGTIPAESIPPNP